MAESGSSERWLSLMGSFLGSVGAISALLFYFGYASTRAKYEYFGIDVDTVGLDTRDFLMRSPQPLLVPLVTLGVLALLGAWLHMALSGIIDGASADPAGQRKRRNVVRRAALVVLAAGSGVLAGGLVLVLLYSWLRDWSAYEMVTPLCLMTGVVLITYGWHVRERLSRGGAGSAAVNASSVTLRRTVRVLCGVVVAGSVFWAASTLAEWSGRGQAVTLAGRFAELPSVILDTKERLYVRDPVINETVLPIEGGQVFRYRYRGFRLLIEGGERLFLVPETWSTSGTTLVVQMDESVRVQFQFQNPG